jgi:capsid protein
VTALLPHRRALAFYGASTERDAPPMTSTGEAALREASTLRRRSADLVRNDPLITNALGLLRRGIVANPHPVSRNPKANAAFVAWAKACGYKHSHGTFAAIQIMVAHHLVQDGEYFLQRVWTSSPWSPNGLMLAVWPARLVDKSRGHNNTGHEYEDGVWSGTWFQGDAIEPGYQLYQPVFVPRRDLVWGRYVFEGDQVDGLPRAHASIEAAQQLGEFAATSLVQQKVSACVAAMVVADDQSIWSTGVEMGTRIEDQDGNAFEDLQPGSIPIVYGAKAVHSMVPSSQAAFDVRSHNARVAAGMSMTAESISGDMGQANYSSARHAMLQLDGVLWELDEYFDPAREQVLLWWREAEALACRDWSADVFEWLERPQQSIDPEKTAKADEIEIRLGIKSRRQAIAERGRDPEQVFAETRAEREEFGNVQESSSSEADAEDDTAEDDRAERDGPSGGAQERQLRARRSA